MMPTILEDGAIVVRGGRAFPSEIAASMFRHDNGCWGICVVSANHTALADLSSTVPHRLITTSYVGEFRKMGGDVVPISGRSPFAAALVGLQATAPGEKARTRPSLNRSEVGVVALFADFNNCDRLGHVRLNTEGTRDDLAAMQIVLSDGLPVQLDDHDELLADGIVRRSAEGSWVAQIDWDRLLTRPNWEAD